MGNSGNRTVISLSLVSLMILFATACNTVPRETVQMGPYEKYDRLNLPEAPRFTTDAYAESTLDADLDDGGEVALQTFGAFATSNFPLWKGAFGFAMGSYERKNYDFDGDTKFFNGTDDPFEDFNSFRLTGVLAQAFSREWGLAGVVSMGHSWETGADIEDGRSMFYGLGGFYNAGDGLVIAGGLGLSDSEDGDGDRELSVVPGIQLWWRIADQWEAFILGPNAWVQYTFADHWIVRLGVGIENDTWRIDRGMPGQEDQALATLARVPVHVMLAHQVTEALDINLSIGTDISRNLEIDYGDTDEDDDIDSSLFLRLGIVLYF